ncbi:unnamed protein product, partial [Prorocentrum cordatum]
ECESPPHVAFDHAFEEKLQQHLIMEGQLEKKLAEALNTKISEQLNESILPLHKTFNQLEGKLQKQNKEMEGKRASCRKHTQMEDQLNEKLGEALETTKVQLRESLQPLHMVTHKLVEKQGQQHANMEDQLDEKLDGAVKKTKDQLLENVQPLHEIVMSIVGAAR